MVNIRPVANQILLQVPAVAAEENRGGVIVRGRALREGFRVAVVRRLPDLYTGVLGVGDEVLLPPYCGREVILNGDDLVFVREDQIEAALEA